MDDYYELLGVGEESPVDDIRSAYREKKAAIDTSAGDDAKADVAALNKAWNVLSDPYQRGRYDQQRANADDSDEVDDDDDEESAPVRRRPQSSRADARDERKRKAREPAKPTIVLPAGTHFPATRQRLLAMIIDLGVLFVLFLVASIVIAPAVDRAVHKPIVDRIDVLRKELDRKTKISDQLQKTASNVAKAKGKDSEEAKKAQAVADHYSKHTLQAATDAFNEETKKLIPINLAVTGGALLIGLFYLAIPSAAAGQTVGKRSQGVRAIRVDGSELGFVGSVRRYGLVLLSTFVLLVTPFGALGAALVLFAVTTWTRNPNHQGIHDRLIHTIVVADDED